MNNHRTGKQNNEMLFSSIKLGVHNARKPSEDN